MSKLACHPSRRPSHGYILVLVAMMLWVILGFAALVIDFGLARAKFRQMQSATDVAAIEGLRSELDGSGDRNKARQLAAQPFLFNINLSVDLNATPQDLIVISDDMFPRGGVIEDPRERQWIPSMAANTDNIEGGDLEYRASESTFLARLRHSDQAPISGVRNNSPGLPYLFARTSLRVEEGSPNDVVRGIVLGSTSAASTTRALSMGPAIPSDDIPGVAYVASTTQWAASEAFNIQAGNARPVYSIGHIAPPADSPADNSASGYVAIYDPTSDIANRIVGFGYIQDGAPVPQHVATINATSRILPGANPPSREELQRLLGMNVQGLVQTICLTSTPVQELQ